MSLPARPEAIYPTGNGVALRHRRAFAAAVAIAVLGSGLAASVPVASAQDNRAPGGAWRTSPHHRQINSATGRPIPCLCRYGGRDYRVGEVVCMATHIGTVITLCDLVLNNTSWMPTTEPCATSRPAAPALVQDIDAG